MLLAHSNRSRISSDSLRGNARRTGINFVMIQFLGDHVLTAMVSDTQAGGRLDRALCELFPDWSRSALSRMISKGLVRVDGKPVSKPSHRIERGQRIEIHVPPPAETTAKAQDLPLRILFQDDDVAIIDKQAGVVVHPAAGHADGTLVNALLHHLRDLSGVGGELRPGIVHRLDKDTSGLLVVAKHDAAHRSLTSSWNSEAVRKEYLAIVYGTPSPEHAVIDRPIARDPRNRKRMAVVAGGREAITEYEVIRHQRYVALLRCRLRTGRTHQIRVHLASIGHPIVGDPIYSGPQWRGIPDKRMQKAIASLNRQALHATRLTFPHPRTGESMSFESPLPEDLRRLVES
jgi:23S rRNA pseudouridine1911/1915/1917 synthase